MLKLLYRIAHQNQVLFERKFFFEVKLSLYFNIVRWNFGLIIWFKGAEGLVFAVGKEGEFLARNRIEDVNIEDLEYETESESESESESEEDSSTDSENESFSSFESDDESEVSFDDIEILAEFYLKKEFSFKKTQFW